MKNINRGIGNFLSLLGMLVMLAGLVTIPVLANLGLGLFIVMIGLLIKSGGNYISDNEVTFL